MGEIKHSFTAGRMNKDNDERLVQNGEYRDASNVQIRTTDGGGDGVGEAGTVQNLQGNISTGFATGNILSSKFADTSFTCVGSIPYEKIDSIYFFFTSGGYNLQQIQSTTTEIFAIDTIVEHNARTDETTPVVVDHWAYITPLVVNSTDMVFTNPNTPANNTDIISINTNGTTFASNVRENMVISFYNPNNLLDSPSVKIKKIAGDVIHFYDSINLADWSNYTKVVCRHDRMLQFKSDNLINSINVIDNLLFWTDNVNEPKKINIDRCKKGTSATGDQHTQLFIDFANGDTVLASSAESESYVNNDLLLEHITVIRKAPKTPPTVHVQAFNVDEKDFELTDYLISDNVGWITDGQPTEGQIFNIGYNGGAEAGLASPPLEETSFTVGDTLVVEQINEDIGFVPVKFKVEFLGYCAIGSNTIVDEPTSKIKVKILTLPDSEITNEFTDWKFSLHSQDLDPKFELKFVRFGYRYKYTDGEYSAFSPFSEIAFDPGAFDYDPVKGYNLGMVNTIHKLIIKDFIPYYTDKPVDITEVDILYKPTDSANVYVVKTIRKNVDGEWILFTPPTNGTNQFLSTQPSLETGALEIKSEMIHKVVPSNQLLRTFDNVPRKALAQEITGSRILYGHFTQGFDIDPISLTQSIVSEQVFTQPKRSVKTIRDYTVGMVLGDRYGRETPVVVSNKFTDVSTDTDDLYQAETNIVNVPKELCEFSNKLLVQQQWNLPGIPASTPDGMPWLDYVKYYVKETSNEYYNLVLDRWYFAREENNIWLSFPSADRNKVDLETYLYLKKEHGSGETVLERARYKIIDIVNEAPDFIKTDHRIMGMAEITTPGDSPPNAYVMSGGGDANTGDPNLLTDLSIHEVQIKEGNFDNFLDAYGENMRGTLLARIVGRTENAQGIVMEQLTSGDFKKVTHHYMSDYGNGQAVIAFKKSFGDSANMRDRFNALGYTIADGTHDLKYYMEFKEEVVENRPEFDGRFFVLVEKDFTIEQKVAALTTASTNYIEVDTFTISYVDSQQFNPAQSGPYSYLGSGNDAYASNGGVYNGIDVGDVTVTDDTGNPNEWWGWGRFRNDAQVFYNNEFSETINVGQDSSLAHLFAMGCGSFMFVDTLGTGGGTVGQFGSNGYLGRTCNFAEITLTYWQQFRYWHTGDDSENYGNTNDLGIANTTLVFLDGARAHRFDLEEFGPSMGSLSEGDLNGVQFQNGGSSSDFAVNDKRDYPTVAPSIYNYKPTALDAGNASIGMGRMIISQQWPGNNPPGMQFQLEGGSVWTHFSTPGTRFKFVDDNTDTSDSDFPDGKPYIYEVIDRDVADPSIQLAPQRHRHVKNYAVIGPSGVLTGEFSGFPVWKSATIHATKTIFNNSGSLMVGSDGSSSSFGGQNNLRADASGNILPDCWSGLNPLVCFPNAADDGTTIVNIGVYKNVDSDDLSNESHRQLRNCKDCESSGGASGGYFGSAPSSQFCERSSLRFEFRRLDENGELTNTGVIPEEFDPRGWAKHDGTAGGIKIAILQKTISADGSEPIEIESDRAVWETEPKEDVGLDLYYEASHALPVRLSMGNTLAFAPLKSVITSEYNTVSGNNVDNLLTNMDGDNFEKVIVGGVEYTENKSLIKPISVDGDGNEALMNQIGIGDNIMFTHTSGLQTKSKVLGYYSAPTSNNYTLLPTTSFTATITLDPGTITGVETQGTVTISNYQAGFSESDLVTGAHIQAAPGNTGPNVPGNVFIKYFPGVNIQLSNTIGWLVTENDDGTFDFSNNTIDVIITLPGDYLWIDSDVWKYPVKLGWHNCYSFGNGVESDRIRDDFNAPTIDNGVIVSTTVDQVKEENRSSSLIFSGLYNSTSSVNDLNEFNMGEKIIKDLNPEYGSIQALKTRDSDVVAFCEDRILKVLANKDAVFSADNDPRLVATDRVLGQVSTFRGDYGISKNPESLASDQYRLYFTDTQRGAVLRLSMDGLTPISNVGMKTWFRENLNPNSRLLGTFDKVNGEYNLTLTPATSNGPTVSFNEASKGWVSFKSFSPDEGQSVSGKYVTVKHGTLYTHYFDTFDSTGEVNNRNLFYGAETLENSAHSTLTVMFNDAPGTVKSFKAINYEGSQARIDQYISVSDSSYQNDYYNIFEDKHGWWVSSIETDLEKGEVQWFVDKENKWFNKICGTEGNVDTSQFTVQGLGFASSVVIPDTDSGDGSDDSGGDDPIQVDPQPVTFKIKNNDD